MRFDIPGDDLRRWGTELVVQLNKNLSMVDGILEPGNICGEVIFFSGILWPPNFLLCDGRQVLITAYPTLYASIGQKYASGTVSTGYYKLPSLLAKTPIGLYPLIRSSGLLGAIPPTGGIGTL